MFWTVLEVLTFLLFFPEVQLQPHFREFSHLVPHDPSNSYSVKSPFPPNLLSLLFSDAKSLAEMLIR